MLRQRFQRNSYFLGNHSSLRFNFSILSYRHQLRQARELPAGRIHHVVHQSCVIVFGVVQHDGVISRHLPWPQVSPTTPQMACTSWIRGMSFGSHPPAIAWLHMVRVRPTRRSEPTEIFPVLDRKVLLVHRHAGSLWVARSLNKLDLP